MGFVKRIIDNVIDTVSDVVDEVVDFASDVVEEVVSWVVPEVPELPEFNATPVDSQDLGTQGILLNKRKSDSSLPLIYGTRRVGGNLVFLATSADNEHLYMVISICEGQIAKFTELYIDEQLYATYTGSDSSYGSDLIVSSLTSGSSVGNSSNLSVETTHPAYQQTEEIDGSETTRSLTSFAFFNGTDNGFNATTLTTSGALSFAVSPFQEMLNLGWSTSHLGKGVSHCYFKFKYNSDAFTGLPKINFVIRGKLINTNLSGSTYAYSANPAYCLYDYLTATRYGKGLSASDINTSSFTTAAGVCNTSVTPYTGASSQNLFETHAVLGSNTKIIDNVRNLISPMRAFFTYTSGLYKVVIEGTGSSALSITEDMIISGIQVVGESKQNRYNRVIASFADKDLNYQSNDAIYPPRDETNVGASFKYATMLAADNNEELHFNMTLPATTDYYTAEDLAELVLKRSRAGLRISFTATSEAQNLVVGDIFQITHTGMGFSAKNFIVTGIALSTAGSVNINGVEYTADAYTYNTKIQQPSAPVSFLPDPKTVNAPVLTSITDTPVNVTEGNLNVIMTVTLRNTPDFFVDKFEVVYKKSTDTIYKSAGISSNTVREIPVESGVTYNVKARAINALGYKSAYVAGDHFVVGFSDPPANVANFSIDFQDEIAVLKWDPSADLDLAYYHIRYSPNASDSYPNSIVLVDKVSPPANSVIVPAKTGVYFIKAFDLLGHESLTAGSVIGTVTEFAGQNLATTITEETAFAGTNLKLLLKVML